MRISISEIRLLSTMFMVVSHVSPPLVQCAALIREHADSHSKAYNSIHLEARGQPNGVAPPWTKGDVLSCVPFSGGTQLCAGDQVTITTQGKFGTVSAAIQPTGKSLPLNET